MTATFLKRKLDAAMRAHEAVQDTIDILTKRSEYIYIRLYPTGIPDEYWEFIDKLNELKTLFENTTVNCSLEETRVLIERSSELLELERGLRRF